MTIFMEGKYVEDLDVVLQAVVIAGCCEDVTCAKKVVLNTRSMLDTISTRAAGNWQMSNCGYRILNEDYNLGILVYHYLKDLRIAVEEMKDRGCEMPILYKVMGTFEELEIRKRSKLGKQALMKVYEE